MSKQLFLKMVAFLFVILVLAVLSAQAAPTAPAQVAEIEKVEARARLVRAQAELAEAQVRLVRANVALEAVRAEPPKVAKAKIETQVVRAEGETDLAKAEVKAEVKVTKAGGDAEVERLRHQGEQSRQDNEVRRDNSRDDHRPQGGCSWWAGCVVAVPTTHGYGYGGYYGGTVVTSPGGARITSCGEGGCNTVFSTGKAPHRR